MGRRIGIYKKNKNMKHLKKNLIINESLSKEELNEIAYQFVTDTKECVKLTIQMRVIAAEFYRKLKEYAIIEARHKTIDEDDMEIMFDYAWEQFTESTEDLDI